MHHQLPCRSAFFSPVSEITNKTHWPYLVSECCLKMNKFTWLFKSMSYNVKKLFESSCSNFATMPCQLSVFTKNWQEPLYILYNVVLDEERILTQHLFSRMSAEPTDFQFVLYQNRETKSLLLCIFCFDWIHQTVCPKAIARTSEISSRNYYVRVIFPEK